MNVDLESLEELIRTADIDGFLAKGAPQDEYDLEIELLLPKLQAIPPGSATHPALVALLEATWCKTSELSPEDLIEHRPAFEQLASRLLHFFPA